MLYLLAVFSAAHALADEPLISREEHKHLVKLTHCKRLPLSTPREYNCKGQPYVTESWKCRQHFHDKTELEQEARIYCTKLIYDLPPQSSQEEKILRCLKYDNEENMECENFYCRTYNKKCEDRLVLQNDSLNGKPATRMPPKDEILDGLKF